MKILSDIRNLPYKNEFADICITSPPYWAMRDYGVENQIGLEKTPELYIEILSKSFDEVYRCLKSSGTLFVVIDDTYASNWGHGAKRDSSWWSTKSKEFEGKGWKNVKTVMPPNQWKNHCEIKVKDLIGIPWMLAFSMRKRGWYLRSEIIWYKENTRKNKNHNDKPMRKHEIIFMFSKNQKYFGEYDNIDSVWNIPIKKHPIFHSAAFPRELVKKILNCGCPKNGTIFDPFSGSCTVEMVANELGLKCFSSDLNFKYLMESNKN